jgi:PAS domain S-box-containing protein
VVPGDLAFHLVKVDPLPAADWAAAKSTSAVSILLVDDNSGKRLALKALLLPLGYTIVEANSGTAALRAVMNRDFAIILLDVRMPIMDGFETAGLIRQRRQSEMTPIIFITAYGSDDSELAGRYDEGAVDFIVAPIDPAELRAKVSVFAKLFTRAKLLAEHAQQVQDYADQLRQLTDAAPIGIFQTDTRRRYVYTNARWSELTGIRPDEATGKQWDTLLGIEPDRFEPPSAGVSSGEIHRRFELGQEGSAPCVLQVTLRSIHDSDGLISGWVGILADGTSRTETAALIPG